MEEGVDLSHLTDSERQQILQVMARHKAEEDQERENFKRMQEELNLLSAAVAKRKWTHHPDQSTCNICCKTKFADGVGHVCHNCKVKCCARCGVKVALRNNKVFWLCLLCRKRQEISIRYGKWVEESNDSIPTLTSFEKHELKWGRAHSLEEEAQTEKSREFSSIPLRNRFPSQLNISLPTSSSFWRQDRRQQQISSTLRPDDRFRISGREDFRAPDLRPKLNEHWSSSGRRSSLDTVIRNDSLSSDQSENPPAAPPRPRPRRSNGGRHRRSGGSSGSEDEARTSPSSCSESDRGSHWRVTPSVGRLREPRWRSREDYRQTHSVSWKLSKDGSRYLGHIVLHKEPLPDGTGRQSIGMKVVGGLLVDSGFGALVEKIREGSLADRVAHVQPGDEVLEWNGICLRGKYKDEVTNIINLSKSEPQVKLVVSRPYGSVPPPLDPIDLRKMPPHHLEVHPEALQRDPRYLRYSNRRTSHLPPRSPDRSSVGGRIQVQLWYSSKNLQLTVTVLCAKDLPPRSDRTPRNPYFKIVLLPDASEKSKRRSKTIAKTNDPVWNQSFSYYNFRQSELRNSSLQISLWDYDRNIPYNDFLGEVVIGLGSKPLNDFSEWYHLSGHRNEEKSSHFSTEITTLSPNGSRISDEEEMSDYDEKFLAHTERRIMAVDNSPPFYEEDRRHQQNLPPSLTSPMPLPSPMMEQRSRSLAATPPSPVAGDYTRGRMREAGFENRRRSRSMAADNSARRNPEYTTSRSLSPPELRPRLQPSSHFSNVHLLPPANTSRKRQLPLTPHNINAYSRNDLEERILKGRNPVTPTIPTSTSGGYGEYDRLRRGGGSRMAASLGVGMSSPLASPERSDSETTSKFNLGSAFHRNSRTLGEFTGRSSTYGGPVHPSSREMDGSLSDTAVGLMTDDKPVIRRNTPTDTRPGSAYGKSSPFLSKKSISTSQLSVTGGEEASGSTPSSTGTARSRGRSWSRLPPEVGEAQSFVEGLGPGQLVGRQALASPALGEVQLSICEQKSCLVVEVIRARGLQPKPSAKILPEPYVKLYLLDGRKCKAKKKTPPARRTLDPLYQSTVTFQEDFRNCFLQVTVWGIYSRIENKVFMGVAQIVLDDIDLAEGVIAWYKLFHHSSLVSSLASNNRNSSFLSLDSVG